MGRGILSRILRLRRLLIARVDDLVGELEDLRKGFEIQLL
jgi:hypothetical protein